MEPPDPSIRNIALAVILRAVMDSQHEDQRGYLAAAWLVSERAHCYLTLAGMNPDLVRRWVFSGFLDARTYFEGSE